MNRVHLLLSFSLLFGGLIALPTGAQSAPTSSPLPEGMQAVLLELESPSLATLWRKAQEAGKSNAGKEGQAALPGIMAEQEALIATLTGAKQYQGLQVIFQLQRALNAVAVLASEEDVSALAQLEGVIALYEIPWAEVNNADAAPYLGVQEVWAALGLGLHGEGIRVGIIDTGVDYIHTDFGGSGSEADYSANDPTVIGDIPGFPGEKVVGGYDLAGTDYGLSGYIPVPDPDPMDKSHHGTHVAGSAAGYGVNNDGSTYRGVYDAELDTRSMRVGPGMAPLASIYAIKVFGDAGGSTALTDAGIEWALDPDGDGDLSDHLDLVNISIGSPYTMGEGNSSTFSVIQKATEVGMLIVMSAGNSGDNYYIHGSMSSSPYAMSVGAAWHDGVVYHELRIEEPLSIAGRIEGLWSNFSGPVTEVISAPITVVEDRSPITDPAELPAETVGSIVLATRRSGQYDGAFAKVAEEAGAVGVVFYLPGSSIPYSLYDLSNTSPTIPVLMIGDAEAAAILDQAAATTVRMTLSPDTLAHPEVGETMASFSSRGPTWSNGRAFLKPDLSAPGVETKSAGEGTGDQMLVLKGTSMAAPTAAGVMALLRQQHPDWSPMELKALAMNSASRDLFLAPDHSGGEMAPSRCGAGMIDAAKSVENPGVIAYWRSYPERVSLSYATTEVTKNTREDLYITVENKGEATQSFTVNIRPVLDMPGVEMSLPRNQTIKVAPGKSADLMVRLTADPADMIPMPDSTMDEVTSIGLPRHWISEEQGYIELSSSDNGPVLRVPYYAAPRRATATNAVESSLLFNAESKATIKLEGSGYDSGADERQEPVVAAFELHETMGLGQDYATEEAWRHIQHVGVTTDYPAEGMDGSLYFAVTFYGEIPTPNIAELYGLNFLLSTDGDNYGEYTIAPYGDKQDAPYVMIRNNVTQAAFLVAPINYWDAEERDTATLRTNVLVLPVPLAALNLSQASTEILYAVKFYNDRSNQHRFNFKRPALNFTEGQGGLPWEVDKAGSTFEVRRDLAMLSSGDAIGALLIHFRGSKDARAEVIQLDEFSPGLNASPTSIEVESESGESEVVLTLIGKTQADEITIESAGGFVQATLQTDSAKGLSTLHIRYEKNELAESRTAVVTLSAPSVAPVYIGVNQAGCTAPEAPSLRASQGDYDTHVQVTWNSAPGATRYRVYRSESNNFADATPLSDWLSVYHFMDTSAKAAENGAGCRNAGIQTYPYYYWVIAQGACGDSEAGSAVQGWRGLAVDSKSAAPLALLGIFLALGYRGKKKTA